MTVAISSLVVLTLKLHYDRIKLYEVDRLKQVCRAASLKVGGCGMRYTIVVCGKETYIFEEDGKWFVEAK